MSSWPSRDRRKPFNSKNTMEKKSQNFALKLMLFITLTLFIAHASIGQGKKPTLRPLKMTLVPDTVLRQAAFEILRLEKIVVQQDSTISDLTQANIEKDSAKRATDKMLNEATFREKVLKADAQNERDKAEVWKSEAIKYKRQRNLTFGAVGIVVVAGVVRSLKR